MDNVISRFSWMEGYWFLWPCPLFECSLFVLLHCDQPQGLLQISSPTFNFLNFYLDEKPVRVVHKLRTYLHFYRMTTFMF
ncbi:hypothetical protein GDO81_007059 [Engystomops pustulosus]|uniref:Uncharacterized protein n=1 Tax=Engystomops pustulosus TaxID=76066 RepID=A0AAV7C5P0_ENGPU|nr:hypothetical protein GDO81_007059 [Engystomops pustulosus]